MNQSGDPAAGDAFAGRTRLCLLALLAFAALVVLRDPGLIYPGRLWAEEGAVHFRRAFLERPPVGNAVSAFACRLAVHALPVEWAPVCTGLVALVLQLVPAALLLWSRIPALGRVPHRLAALGLLLLTQPSQDLWLNTIHSKFFLFIGAGVILVSAPGGRGAHLARLATLVLASVSIVPALLLPWFMANYLLDRQPHRRDELLAMALPAMAGLLLLGWPSREGDTFWTALAATLFVKQWVLPLAGSGTTTWLCEHILEHRLYASLTAALVALLPYGLVGAALLRWGRREALLLFTASVFTAGFSFLKSVEARYPMEDMLATHLSAFWCGRYYFGPNVLLAWALLMPVRAGAAALPGAIGYRRVTGFLAVLLLVMGAAAYGDKQAAFFSGPAWRDEVAAWRRNPQHEIQLWPHPWVMRLYANPMDDRFLREGAGTNAVRAAADH